VGLKLLVLFPGIGLGVLIPLAVWLAAQDARNDAQRAAVTSPSNTMPGMAMPAAGEGAMSH
jgi:hypothetical protein